MSIKVHTVDWDKAPVFCRTDDPSALGAAFRIKEDGYVANPHGSPVEVAKEDVIKVAKGNVIVWYPERHIQEILSKEVFHTSFSRLLHGSTTVPLSAPYGEQFDAIRKAQDFSHLRDLATMKADADFNEIERQLAPVIEDVKGALGNVQEKVETFRGHGRKIFGQVRSAAATAAATPEGQHLTAAADILKTRAKRFLWGNKLES